MSEPNDKPESTARSEGADGPVGRVALGLRFELYDTDDYYVGAFLREDIKGAGIPRSGESLARGTFSTLVDNLIGFDTVVDHVEHYLTVPQVKEADPLAMIVVKVSNIRELDLHLAGDALKAEGWTVLEQRPWPAESRS